MFPATWLALVAVLWLPACRQPPPRNLLLITIDTLRPDRLSCYGYTANRTPNIDALAARGVVFDRAFCDVTWTTPSMASVFTGRYATHHGLQTSAQRLDETPTLAKALRSYGYTAAAVVGSFPVDARFGLNQGFDLYDGEFNTSILKDDDPARLLGEPPADGNPVAQRNWAMLKHLVEAYRPDDQVGARAARWLTSERREPFFLWVHFFGPHEKLYQHLPKDELFRRVLAEYDPDVSAVDAQVGVLLRALHDAGLDEQTTVVLHADHGQMLMEQWYVGHGRDLFEQTLRIPLIVAEPDGKPWLPVPRAQAGHTRAFARNIDILPTALDLLGLPVPSDVDGHSLRLAVRHPWFAFLRGMNQGETYAETYMSATGIYPERAQFDGREYTFGFVRRGVRTTGWKYIESDPVPLIDDPTPPVLPPGLIEQHRTRMLYDLQDPFENKDVSGLHPDVVATLRDALQAYTHNARHAPELPLDDASKERLRSLGYAP